MAPFRRSRWYNEGQTEGGSMSALDRFGMPSDRGVIAMVRPDGYVGCTVWLEGRKSVEALKTYFRPFLSEEGLRDI